MLLLLVPAAVFTLATFLLASPTPAKRKELWIEPEATHRKVWVNAEDEYRRRLADFLEGVIGGAPAAAP